MRNMNILQIAIEAAGSQVDLAEELDVTPQCITNWIRRGSIPHMATRVIKMRYAKQISRAMKREQEERREDME